MSDTAKWYVIHTYSGYENKVAANIEKVVDNRNMRDLIQEVRIPVEKVTEISGNKIKEVERKIFPSYVLIKMIKTDESWYVVRNTRGVTGFVGPSSDPTPLTEKEVEALGVNLSGEPNITVEYKVGDDIRVTGTAMDGLAGVVTAINLEAGTVDVLISMFGRDTPATLALNQVLKI